MQDRGHLRSHADSDSDASRRGVEEPTVCHATALALALLGRGDGWARRRAWAYLVIRVLHSFVQALWNRSEVRFGRFALSSLALVGIVGIAVRAVL